MGKRDTATSARIDNGHAGSGTWRVVLVDDHEVTRSGIRAMASAIDGIEVVGEASTGAEGVRMCAEHDPELVLMDLELPELHGIEAIRRIKSKCPNTSVLVLTVHEDEEAVFQAIHAGASGYLSKTASMDELRDAFYAMRSGGTYMSPEVAGIALRSLSRRASEAEQASRVSDVMTEREREVLDHLGRGMSARSIARRLSISERTVNTHIGHIYRKLGVNNRVDAVLAAMRLGLVKNTG